MSPFEINTSFNNRSVHSRKDLSFDEVLVDVQLDDPEQVEGERHHFNYRILGLVLLVVFAVLLGRVYYLQAVSGSDYRLIAEGNKLRNQYILAPRGLILDKHGKIIANNTPSFELVVIPSQLTADAGLVNYQLATIAEVTGEKLEDLRAVVEKLNRKSPHPSTLIQNLPKDPALVLISRKQEFPGFAVQDNPIRDYKDPLVFSHVVGYTGKITAEELAARPNEQYLLNDYIGKTGLELQYEKQLKGVPGSNQTEINAQGDFNKTLPAIPPQPGNNLVLNIDYDLQTTVYNALNSALTRAKAVSGAAVATNPQTGQVLAMVSLPGYDNNLFARGIKSAEYNALLNNRAIPLLNRAINGTYPPGSTIKPLLAIAALKEGIVTPRTIIKDDGVIRVGSYTFYGYRRDGLGLMDVYTAIARSSNIYFYTIGGGNANSPVKEGLGPTRVADWYRQFGFGSALGIDLPNEKEGLVPDPEWSRTVKNEPWYLGNTYHLSIGQGGLAVTPLQINNAIATIANGGRQMQPYLVSQVQTEDGEVVEEYSPRVLKENFLDAEHVKVVQDAMRLTVTDGSGRALANLPIPVSGKTGTAQFDGRDLRLTHAWFTSYAPSDNPQIALTVLIESGGEGSTFAVPVAREVLEWWANNRHLINVDNYEPAG